MGIKRPSCHAAAIVNHGDLVRIGIVFQAGLNASGDLALAGGIKRGALATAIIDRWIIAQTVLA